MNNCINYRYGRLVRLEEMAGESKVTLTEGSLGPVMWMEWRRGEEEVLVARVEDEEGELALVRRSGQDEYSWAKVNLEESSGFLPWLSYSLDISKEQVARQEDQVAFWLEVWRIRKKSLGQSARLSPMVGGIW